MVRCGRRSQTFVRFLRIEHWLGIDFPQRVGRTPLCLPTKLPSLDCPLCLTRISSPILACTKVVICGEFSGFSKRSHCRPTLIGSRSGNSVVVSNPFRGCEAFQNLQTWNTRKARSAALLRHAGRRPSPWRGNLQAVLTRHWSCRRILSVLPTKLVLPV